MDNSKQPDDSGLTHIQRLNPEQFDIVLGAHPGKLKATRPPASGSLGRTLIWLTALVIGAYAVLRSSGKL